MLPSLLNSCRFAKSEHSFCFIQGLGLLDTLPEPTALEMAVWAKDDVILRRGTLLTVIDLLWASSQEVERIDCIVGL